jgi:SAM-dependent methyltransferase
MEFWETVHRWEWFRRRQWLGNFRDGKVLLAASIMKVLNDLGLSEGLVLDCSCGLGFQAIVLREAGLRVHGSDRAPFAVERARELSREIGNDIDFFVSRWDELPARTPLRFDAVFCDALSWLHSRDELVAAFRGLRGVLRPGGVLMFQGEPQGATRESSIERLERWWESVPRASVNWRHQEGPVTCTSMTLGSRGVDYIDWHLTYLLEEANAQEEKTLRLEHFIIRESLRWGWQDLFDVAAAAGFSRLYTHVDAEWSPRGRPVGLNVAVVGYKGSDQCSIPNS